MVNKCKILTIFFLLVSFSAFTQKEANNWYFGANAALDFGKGTSVAINNNKMYSSEGCASISNYNGRLLFYSDGVSVWDSTHSIMPNGSNLKGNSSSSQSAIIIPKPYSFTRYYIFTVDNVAGTDGLTYSEVDMSYNKGRGDIIASSKNKKLVTPVCEKITAIKHANGVDYWILVHKFNSDLIFAYRVTMFGVMYWPVISKTGFNISGPYSNTLGYMKCSPDGRKIAYANFSMDTNVIADFNTKTGKVSKVWTFHNDDAYGLEFSPKSKYLYVSEFNTKKIFQYNGKALTKQDFLASKTIIDSNYSSDVGALQLGPSGKMYISVTGSQYLQVIHAPDSAGFKSRPQKNYAYLGGRTCLLGLPNFSPTIFNRKIILVNRNCLNDSTIFEISNTNDIDSVVWNFGDPLSGANDFSRKITNVSHIYKKTGYYTVNLLYYYKNKFNWAGSYRFYVRDPKPYIGRDTGFCNNFTLDLTPQKSYPAYQWNNGSTTKVITASKKGNYILKITDSAGCSASDSLLISNPLVRANFSIADTMQCSKNNVFDFKDISSYDDDNPDKISWDFGDGTKHTGDQIKKIYSSAGIYAVQLSIESRHHCLSVITRKVTVLANPRAVFSASSPCFPDGVIFNNQSSVSGGKIIAFFWDFGDKTTSILANPVKFYAEPSDYTVGLSVISVNGCTDSVHKHKGVTVKPKPKAVFSFSEVSSLNNGKRIVQFNNLSSDDVTTNYWTFGNGKTSTDKNPQMNYMDSGKNKFTLKVTNNAGCSDTFSITTFHKFYFHLPNAFSPDANNINETFGPVSSLYVNSYKMEIFNQWGGKIFESKDLSAGWDGNYMGQPCPDGLYICKISLTPYNGALENYESVVRLMR